MAASRDDRECGLSIPDRMAVMFTTRARAKKWFRRNFSNRIQRTGKTTVYVSHSSNLVCVRYYEFKFVNPHHPDFDRTNPEWD
jgi:hypothetical protein